MPAGTAPAQTQLSRAQALVVSLLRNAVKSEPPREDTMSGPTGKLAAATDISAEDILAGVSGVLEHFVDAAATSDKPSAPSAFDGDEKVTIRQYLSELFGCDCATLRL